jgi:hypothetical protein
VVDGSDDVVERVPVCVEQDRETVEVERGDEFCLEPDEEGDLRGVVLLEADCFGDVGGECCVEVFRGEVLL